MGDAVLAVKAVAATVSNNVIPSHVNGLSHRISIAENRLSNINIEKPACHPPTDAPDIVGRTDSCALRGAQLRTKLRHGEPSQNVRPN